MRSVVIKSVDAAEVRAAMDRYAARLLAEHPEIEEIVVFGSFARGDYAPGSDLDVLVRLRAADLPVRDRIPALLPDAFPVPVDLFPYTNEELARLEPSPLLDEARRSTWRYGRP